ncbi:MAG: DUF1566 domain-containing protein [Bacteroidaceae bacterium]|nr:DUF1566 domain-containing protein [Bacteroidaceae bacterium]
MKKLFSFFVIALMAIGVNAGNGNNGTTVTGGPYKVGDYYNDGTKEGIVFEVYDGGWHGKIVSLDESEEQWAVDAVFKNVTGATSKGGGMGNMNKIKKQPNWKSNYPAFAWCASLGNGWYLPAVDELILIYENKSTISSSLNEMGYGEITSAWYWSSTERVEKPICALCVDMDCGEIINTYYKSNRYCVRAVSAF